MLCACVCVFVRICAAPVTFSFDFNSDEGGVQPHVWARREAAQRPPRDAHEREAVQER